MVRDRDQANRRGDRGEQLSQNVTPSRSEGSKIPVNMILTLIAME